MEVILSAIALLISFYLLAIICDEFFVPSLDIISKKLKLNSDVAGATFMAMGSSAPELFTSLIAVFRPGDTANVGAGTIVGSAIFNILVIIGASSLFRSVKLTWQPVIRDMMFYIVTILLLLYTFWDGKIVLSEAMIMVSTYLLYVLAVVYWKKILPYNDVDPIEILEEDEKKRLGLPAFSYTILSSIIPDAKKKPDRFFLSFLLSIVSIAGLSYLLVESIVHISTALSVNATFLALTILAAGTSIPDLLSSMIVARQGRGDMAVSNAVGSNVFDILFGLGVPWLIVLAARGGVVMVNTENLLSSVFLLFATVCAIVFILIVRKWRIGQKSGLVLIGLYLAYIIYVFLNVR